jgi:hypothetical protein
MKLPRFTIRRLMILVAIAGISFGIAVAIAPIIDHLKWRWPAGSRPRAKFIRRTVPDAPDASRLLVLPDWPEPK